MKKFKKLLALMLVAIMTLAIAACGSSSDEETTEEATEAASETVELNILAAASMTDVLTELGDAYMEANPDVKLTFTFDSSGTLQTQIEEGAPADLFLSAATKQMNALNDEDLMDQDSEIDLLENKCVLIKPAGSDLDIESFEDVATDKVEMVAIGNSDVPVGQYTQTIYENLGLWDQIEAKANLGTNVRQVLDWVATENADCGIVYATDAAIEDKVEVVAEAPEGSCDPAIYPAGVVKASENKEAAQAFLDYLKTDEAKTAFEKYQFTYIYEE